MQPTDPNADASRAGLLNAVPAWGSYLYQNFLLPAFSPNVATEWLNLNSPFGSNPNGQPSPDYFSQAWSTDNATAGAGVNEMSSSVPVKMEPGLSSSTFQPAQSGPSSFYPQPYYYNSSIPTSLLVGPQAQAAQVQALAQAQNSNSFSASSSKTISPSIDVIDAQIARSPSPFDTSSHVTPHLSPKLGTKRRADSLESDLDHSHDEHDHEVPEGVERDGMIWGMKVEDYRALSARERKRVRNRISARTFRAKRKEHLTSLESTLGAKDLQIKLANEEASRLRHEVLELKRRLAKYEKM
ncbi:hypothetical protein EHS25_004340 [Saitozyma podzolica]|uniref:BZIP domain-containing protein n=1 Tax=Saitozyma podzolica TaxID=1890683 RepID=A0A427YU19_9TREE|nr:hypothetical protein EHS25_004340 [Saitozyma podzolica]